VALATGLSSILQFIKGGFSFRLKRKHDVWMRSFNESQIVTEEKFISCARYIEANPVRRGLVATPVDTASARRFVEGWTRCLST
jgi:putative transposase